MFRKHLYPKNWNSISKAVLARDGYRCQRCKIRHLSIVTRLENGGFLLWYVAETHKEGREFVADAFKKSGRKLTLVTLQCCHRYSHEPAAVDEDNLFTQCSKCHFDFDNERHNEKTKATKQRKREAVEAVGFETDDSPF